MRAGPHRNRWMLAANLSAVVLISLLDWLTPAGVVVGILLSLPIILSSLHDGPREIWLVAGVALVGFVVAALLGRGPISPALVWVPNRIFAFLTIPASLGIALLLQRHRREAVRARDEAMASSEVNRLLMSLLAHDLRSPLVMAVSGLDYVESALEREEALDQELLADLRARLQRSLRAIEVVLSVARPETAGPAETVVRVDEELEAEVESFRHEAEVRGKALYLDVGELEGRRYRVEGLVLRQTVAILVDNAIRHADPGPVLVSARLSGEELVVCVEDSGPGLPAGGDPSRASDGLGIGLNLCRTLVARTGGSLQLERSGPDGTSFALHLPVAPPA